VGDNAKLGGPFSRDGEIIRGVLRESGERRMMLFLQFDVGDWQEPARPFDWADHCADLLWGFASRGMV